MKRPFLIFSSFFLFAAPALAQVACTMDAKQCPDGTYVARNGPNCTFSPCPGEGGATEKPKDDKKDSDKKSTRRERLHNQLLNRDILYSTDGRTAGRAANSDAPAPAVAAPAPQADAPSYDSNVVVQPPPRLYNNISPRQDEVSQPAAESMDQSRHALDSWLSDLTETEGAQISEFSNGAASDLFSGYRFYVMRFPEYPVARAIPAPLKASNIFAVSDSRVVTHIPDESHLRSFFLNALPRLPDENRQRDALRVWLAMMQELQQDSYFRFSQPDSIAITSTNNGWSVSGKVDVVQGGRGGISAILNFDSGGNFLTAETDAHVSSGARPL